MNKTAAEATVADRELKRMWPNQVSPKIKFRRKRSKCETIWYYFISTVYCFCIHCALKSTWHWHKYEKTPAISNFTFGLFQCRLHFCHFYECIKSSSSLFKVPLRANQSFSSTCVCSSKGHLEQGLITIEGVKSSSKW